MSDERRHAEEVADAIISHDDGDTNQGKWRARVADLIQRERADLLARAEAAEERLAYEWEGVRDLRAKLAAAEARVAEAQMERDAWRARAEVAEGARALSEAQANFQAACVQSVGAQRDEAITRAEVAEARVTELQTAWSTAVGWHSQGTAAIDRAEKAEAAAGQMRAALEVCKNLTRHQEWAKGEIGEIGRMVGACVDAALTDAGRGYLSPEQVAQACAAARDAALEEAAVAATGAADDFRGDGLLGYEYAALRASDRIRALKGGTR